MISISNAKHRRDFEIAGAFCRTFAEWDAVQSEAHGLSPDLVLGMYHTDTSETLAAKFMAADAALFIATWNGMPAGCLAFSPFDDHATELHKFYVDPAYRGKGIGRALMRTVLGEIEKGQRRTVLLATTVYMKEAVALYESFAFARCQPFYPIPDSMKHTEVFMMRTI